MSIDYQVLDPRKQEIRLLDILPNSSLKCARIPECSIGKVSLLENPSYEALSYAWGSPTTNRVILVEGVQIRVPENLYNALMGLRPTTGVLTIWIDYLCINQKDETEKSWQVGMMKDIYSHASRVLAWLGPADYETARAIQYLNKLGQTAEVCGFHYGSHQGTHVWEEFSNPALDASLKDFFKKAWWGRLWVLQEIAVPKRAEFVSGSLRISRTRLCAALNACQALWTLLMGKFANKDFGLISKYQLEVIMNYNFRPVVMVNAWRLYDVDRFSLVALLRLTCVGSVNLSRHGPHHLEASDPRDKIFALLGLARDREELERKGLYPDYTKSCQELYCLSAAILLQQGHLSLLSYVQYPKRQRNLPSWVPDWSASITHPLQILGDDHMTHEPEFCAGGRSKCASVVVNCNMPEHTETVISLDGYVYDKIEAVARFPRRQSTHEIPLVETFSWSQEWLAAILLLTYKVNCGFTTFQGRLRAVARTSVGGAAYTQDDQPGKLFQVGEDRFSEAAFLLWKSLKLLKNKAIEREARMFLNRLEVEFQYMRITSVRLVNEINGRSLRRLPFITKKGHLGLSGENIKQGDHVVIIRGAQVPYVLRLQPTGTYQLLSEAYVDGVMDGQAAEAATFLPLLLE
ncbi:hypothetical protein RRF57_012983 [Xylaria bambusicola]|uniref:Heterokaryon incompatibility domain-containing protein n=1 Tax=Xylaria bambusicola TaxID=326684 RepID=A0AAN7V170_9PEZI